MSQTRRIVLTGVSRGLGAALLEAFVAAGHAVAGCCRSAKAVEGLRGRFPAPCRFDSLDVSDDGQVARWAEAVLREFGTPDLLVHNAATINPNAPLWEVPAEEFSRVVDVNVKGTASVVRHFAPAMIAQGRGVLVNFSSTWGRTTSPEVAPYCATKFAVEGLTGALAQELPEGMAAVALNPGIIDTDMLRSCFGAGAAAYPKPSDWARRAAPYLLGLGPEDNGRSLTAP